MKLETIKKHLAKAEPGKLIGPYEIDIQQIRQDPTLQVRTKLDDTNLTRLRAAYRSEKIVQPITLAIIEEGDAVQLPVIIDGHHRVTVLETLAAEATVRGGRASTTVQAMFLRLSMAEARWQAANANGAHGVPLKGPELRAMFRRYVEAGHHRRPDGQYKSYREVGRVIGKTHPTILTWMKADFPKEAAQMGNDEKVPKAGGDGAPAPLVLFKHKGRAALGEFMRAQAEVAHHERQEMIDWLRAALEEMERVQGRTDAFSHDYARRDRHMAEDF